MASVQKSLHISRVISIRVLPLGINRICARSYGDSAEKQSLFQKLWDSSSVSTHTNAHSKTLTSNLATYKLQCK